jgi:hypothetical protein
MNNWNYHTNKLSNDTNLHHCILFSNTTINNNNPSIKITKTNNEFPIVTFVGFDLIKFDDNEDFYIKFDDNDYEEFDTAYRNHPCDLVKKIKESKKIYIKTNVHLGKVYKHIDNINECVYEFDCEGLVYSQNRWFEYVNKNYINYDPSYSLISVVVCFVLFAFISKIFPDYMVEPPTFFLFEFISLFIPYFIVKLINGNTPKFIQEEIVI